MSGEILCLANISTCKLVICSKYYLSYYSIFFSLFLSLLLLCLSFQSITEIVMAGVAIAVAVAVIVLFLLMRLDWVLCYVKLNQRRVKRKTSCYQFILASNLIGRFCNFSQIINSISAQISWYNATLLLVWNISIDHFWGRCRDKKKSKYAHHKYYTRITIHFL